MLAVVARTGTLGLHRELQMEEPEVLRAVCKPGHSSRWDGDSEPQQGQATLPSLVQGRRVVYQDGSPEGDRGITGSADCVNLSEDIKNQL